jgi:hypothetical protein
LGVGLGDHPLAEVTVAVPEMHRLDDEPTHAHGLRSLDEVAGALDAQSVGRRHALVSHRHLTQRSRSVDRRVGLHAVNGSE